MKKFLIVLIAFCVMGCVQLSNLIPPPLSGPSVTVVTDNAAWTTEMVRTYTSNRPAFDNRYEGKYYQLTSEVTAFDENYVDFAEASCHVLSHYKERIYSMQKGDIVTVVGRLEMGTVTRLAPILRECEIK